MKNQEKNDKNTCDDGIKIADLEALRKALGAAADLASRPQDGQRVSTVMCPSHPWDR